MELNNFEAKLFITDIDGVWTDGGMYYGSDGTEFKKFVTADSAGVLLLKVLNIPVVIITGEETVIVENRANKLKIKYLYQGVSDKLSCAMEIIKHFDYDLKSVAFIGDDLNDLALLEKVGLSACPQNAPDYIKERVMWVLPTKGGEGAFRYFVEQYLREKGILEDVLRKIKIHFSNS